MNHFNSIRGAPFHKSQFISETLRKLIRKDAPYHILKIVEKTRPEDIGEALNYLTTFERSYFFNVLSNRNRLAADIISFADEHIVSEVLERLDRRRICEILKSLPSDDAADIIDLLPEDLATFVLSMMKAEESEELESILRYPGDSAGGIMDTNFLGLNLETRASEAIEEVRKASENIHVFYLYVLNENNQLVGVLSLRKLIMVPPEKRLKDIMNREVITIHPEEDQEVAANIVEKYDLMAIPVVDEYNKLLGIITVDDIIDVIREEATEDLLMIAGADEKNITERAGLRYSFNRFVWMGIYLIAGITASELIFSFENLSRNVILWAGFIPVILIMGGGMGNQSSILLISGIDTLGLPFRHSLKLILKEFWISLVAGTGFGGVILLFIVLRHPQNLLFGLSVALSVTVTIVTGALLGSVTPLLLKRFRLDPALAVGPLFTALLYVVLTALYLCLVSLSL